MAWVAIVAAVLMAGSARASCFSCGPDLTCIDVSAGGRFCVQAPNVCSVVMSCSSGGSGPLHDPGDPGLECTSITLLEDAPLATFGAPGRVLHGAGRGVFARAAAQVLRGPRGGLAREPAVVTALLSYGDGGEVAFRTRTGDGFSLERRREGRVVHLVVRELSAGARPLADERLTEDDLLLVRVTVAGQPRLLVLQAQAPSGFEAQRQADLWRQALRAPELVRASEAVVLTPEALRP